MENQDATTALIENKARIDALLTLLQGHSDNHFGVTPDKIHWGHVGDAEHWAELLEEIAEFSGLKEPSA